MKRRLTHRPLVAGLLTALCLLGFSTASRAADDLQGSWKLVILAFGSDEFAIVDLHKEDGQTKGVLVDAQKRILGDNVKLGEVKAEGDAAEIELISQSGPIRFKGSLVKDGPRAGEVLGSVLFGGSVYPARLEKTIAEQVQPSEQGPLVGEFVKLARETNAEAKVTKLQELIDENADDPANHLAYSELLAWAERGGLGADDVEKLVNAWLDQAKAYGEAWTSEVRVKALRALEISKPFANTALRLAQEADKDLAEDAPAETKAVVVGLLAKAAANAGKPELVNESMERLAKLEDELDAEYRKNVPPFKPATYEGRKSKEANQPVVFELFTGAQCPPCVAADVAFDAVLKTYEPTELIGLQYHLHIPGPDPLTNRDSIARQQYYGSEVRGTPSTFFNGQSAAPGGGGMANAEAKYQQYRGVIDELLEQTRKADVTLSADRQGDEIAIKAEAKATEKPNESAQLKLRLALTEESIRYVGGNKIRFHHHVVRALPGGPDGKAFDDDKASVDLKVNLGDVKKEIEAYLDEASKVRTFPTAFPDIDLKDLSVVAFVQDDSDHAILAAVSVPVKDGEAAETAQKSK